MSRLLLLAALGLTTACAVPDDAGLDVSLGISPTPPTVGDTRVVVTLAGPEAQASGLEVWVAGTRKGADSGSPELGAARQPSGDYVVPDFPFDAPGEWTLRVRVELDGGRQVERTFPVRVVGPLRSAPRTR
jgi:hypothetical protein